MSVYSPKANQVYSAVHDLPPDPFLPKSRGLSTRTSRRSLRSPKANIRPSRELKNNSTKRLKTQMLSVSPELDPMLIDKIKPQNLQNIDKLSLYEQNLQFQFDYNTVKCENIHLKTQISRLQKELNSSNELQSRAKSPNLIQGTTHLVSNLKQVIKELRSTNKEYEKENKSLKKKINSTRITELEVEIQAYNDEWLRLKHYLQQAMDKIRNSPVGSDSEQPKIQSLLSQVASLHQQLIKERESKQSLENIVLKRGGHPNTPSTNTDMVSTLSAEVKHLKEQLRSYELAATPKKPLSQYYIPSDNDIKMLEDRLSAHAQDRGETAADIIQSLDTGNGTVSIDKLIKFCTETSLVERQEVLYLLCGKLSVRSLSQVPINLLKEYFSPESTSTSSAPTSTVSELFRHVSLRMQLHRLEKSYLSEILFGHYYQPSSSVSANDLMTVFIREPFTFNKKADMQALAEYLVQPTATQDAVLSKLISELDDWEPFLPNEEKDFDKLISTQISENRESFENICCQYDPTQSGYISMENLKTVLKSLDIDFTTQQFRYLTLLFYSHSKQLDKVPYMQFLEAYGTGRSYDDSRSSLDSEERVECVRKCISLIASTLAEAKLDAKDIFKVKEGLLYADDFLQGLKDLGMGEIPKQYVFAVMEGLQSSKEEDDVCMDFIQFVNLLNKAEGDGNTVQSLSFEAVNVPKLNLSADDVGNQGNGLESPPPEATPREETPNHLKCKSNSTVDGQEDFEVMD